MGILIYRHEYHGAVFNKCLPGYELNTRGNNYQLRIQFIQSFEFLYYLLVCLLFVYLRLPYIADCLCGRINCMYFRFWTLSILNLVSVDALCYAVCDCVVVLSFIGRFLVLFFLLLFLNIYSFIYCVCEVPFVIIVIEIVISICVYVCVNC